MNATVTSGISKEQVQVLERLIATSPNASIFAKKCIIWLLRLSDRLTKGVCVSIRGELGQEVARSAHDMQSANGQTHLSKILKSMGSRLLLSHHYGRYAENIFVAGGRGMDGGTIWFSERVYDHQAERIEPDMVTIEAIDLKALAE